MKHKGIIHGLWMAVFLPFFLSGCAGQEKNTETASPLPTPTEAAVSDVPDDDTPTPMPTQEAEASPTAFPTPTDEAAVKPDILEWYWEIDGLSGGKLERDVLSELVGDEVEEKWFIFFETELEDVYVTAPRVYGRYDDPPDPPPSPSDYDVYTFAEDAVYIMSSGIFEWEERNELLGVEEIGCVYFRTTKESWRREYKRPYTWLCGVKDKVIYYVYPFIGP